MLRELRLYWKSEGRDITLGSGYFDGIPRQGELLSFVCEHGTTWRVVTVHRGLVMEDSAYYNMAVQGGRIAPLGVDLMVAKAEGPFEP